jgi:hypothetical protein
MQLSIHSISRRPPCPRCILLFFLSTLFDDKFSNARFFSLRSCRAALADCHSLFRLLIDSIPNPADYRLALSRAGLRRASSLAAVLCNTSKAVPHHQTRISITGHRQTLCTPSPSSDAYRSNDLPGSQCLCLSAAPRARHDESGGGVRVIINTPRRVPPALCGEVCYQAQEERWSSHCVCKAPSSTRLLRGLPDVAVGAFFSAPTDQDGNGVSNSSAFGL